MGGAQFVVAESGTGAQSPIQAGVRVEEEQASTPTAQGAEDERAACAFDVLKLDEQSERDIEKLRGGDEVVVFMPVKEFVIAHGPKRTVLYWLCRNVRMAEGINGFLEGA